MKERKDGKVRPGKVASQEKVQQLRHPLQTIMSRTGSFPLHVAYSLLEKYGGKQCIVLDPFCGKGTTLLAARMLGFPAFGIDVAPEAIICSTAKTLEISFGSLYNYIESLRLKNLSLVDVPPTVRTFFHASTLRQIISIRNQVIRDMRSINKQLKANAQFTMAILLGILHGHASYSLSISSAHAYSMSPNYVNRYATKFNLKAPKRDVRSCLIEKASRCLSAGLPKQTDSDVRRGSAINSIILFPELAGKVDLILTSPPYLNAQTYAKDNWLRLWLLNFDYKDIQNEYIHTSSVKLYGEYMKNVFRALNRMLKPGGRLICIAGDVRLRKRRVDGLISTIFQTSNFLASICESEEIGFEIEQREEQIVPSNMKYFHALSKSNGHLGSSITERLFVARKR